MKKYLLFLMMPMLVVGCAVDPATTYRATLPSTVRLEGDGSVGSGVVLNDHCVLTAKHVVEDEPHLMITTTHHKEFVVTKRYLGEYSDMAVVCVDEDLFTPPVRVRTEMPKLYTPVFVLGNPLGIENWLTTGQYEGGSNISAPIVWGNSGGGVFDESGSLIGIAIAMRVKEIEQYVFVFPHLGFITNVRDIVPFLNANHIAFQQA